ncbi:MAG: hypothetical protein ACXWZP_08885, partial [Gaiellaceae bacterium]
TVTYTTTAAATVTATLLDVNGAELALVVPPTHVGAGEHTLMFDGLGQPDGVYTLVLEAVGSAGFPVTRELELVVTRTLGSASLAPAVVTPNGDGTADELTVSFQLAVPATVRLRVLRDGKWVATPFSGPLPAGPQTVVWNGARRAGRTLDGSYSAVIEAADSFGTAAISLPFLLDARAPTIRLAARPPRIWLSEAAAVSLRVNGSLRRLELPGPGFLVLSGIRKVRSIVVVARDAAGNKAVLRRPL